MWVLVVRGAKRFARAGPQAAAAKDRDASVRVVIGASKAETWPERLPYYATSDTYSVT